MAKLKMVGSRVWVLVLVLLLLSVSISSSSGENKLKIDGKVLELDESNFESAISAFDLMLVDFYAPWCGHCKRLSPQLDEAAPVLASLKEPVVIAKVNADKYTRLARKYDVDGYPSLKIFTHGVPTEYYGPRKADLLVRYIRKFVAPNVTDLSSDAAVKQFIDDAGNYFPIYIGFGLEQSVIFDLALKYKKKAWFAVAKDFSEDMMVLYDFDKVPALVAIQPTYNERSIFYGPFEDEFLEDFIKQNFLPLSVPINQDTLKLLKDDNRKIVLTIVEDEAEEKSHRLIKVLRAAASANRDLVFAYVGIKQWGEFAETFGANKKSKLPKMIIWDGDEEYFTVIGSESIDDKDEGSQISSFLEGYREGRTEQKRIAGPSLIGFINSLIGIRTVYIIVFLVAMLMIIRSVGREDDESPRDGARDEYGSGDKED